MPTIKEKLYFNFDGTWSDEYGLINVSLNAGMYDDLLFSSRTIIEKKTKGMSKPMFYGIDDSPIEFEMTLAFEKNFNPDDLRLMVKWLFVDYYKPLYFLGEEDIVFYCMPVNDSRIIHNGINQGYFTLKMRCDSPYVYSQVKESEITEIANGESKTVEIFNEGYDMLYPEISIKKNGAGNVSIQNITKNGDILQIANLVDQEEIYINTEKEIIDTNAIGIYRYNDISGYFPNLSDGENLLKITGDCTIQFRYQYKYRF